MKQNFRQRWVLFETKLVVFGQLNNQYQKYLFSFSSFRIQEKFDIMKVKNFKKIVLQYQQQTVIKI